MPVDVYYSPGESAQSTTVQDLAHQISLAGFPCFIEPEADGIHRIVLEPLNSSLVVSVDKNIVTFVTFEGSLVDESGPDLAEAVDQIMTAIGFSAGDE